MSIPLFDLKRVLKPFSKELQQAYANCFDHGMFISGPEVTSFESAFSKKINSKYCIGMSSGTDALQAIFMALQLKPGSEIIVPSFTFIASASSIVRAGLKPVFADLEAESFHLSLRTIKKAWTRKTRAVLFVHLFGEPENLKEIKKFCDDKNAYLVEDCAQSYGSTAGKMGLASAYSFFPAKNLGCLGDGGAVATDDLVFAEKIKSIRTHGCVKKYHYDLLGGNFRLDTMQAAFLEVLLGKSDAWIETRRNNARYYKSELSNIKEIKLPRDCPGHAWNQYTLRTNRRDELKKFLDNNNIGNAIYYPIPLHHSKNIFGKSQKLPETDARCKEVLSIPIYPGLSDLERETVVLKLKEFFNDT